VTSKIIGLREKKERRKGRAEIVDTGELADARGRESRASLPQQLP